MAGLLSLLIMTAFMGVGSFAIGMIPLSITLSSTCHALSTPSCLNVCRERTRASDDVGRRSLAWHSTWCHHTRVSSLRKSRRILRLTLVTKRCRNHCNDKHKSTFSLRDHSPVITLRIHIHATRRASDLALVGGRSSSTRPVTLPRSKLD